MTWIVDIKDVALLHVAAIIDPEVNNARLQAWGHHSSWNDALAIMRKQCPRRKFIANLPDGLAISISTDFSQPLTLLQKWGNQDGWTPFEKTVTEDVKKIIEW